MEEDYPFPEYSKEDFDRAFDEAYAAAENLHNKLISFTQDVGYIKNVIGLVKSRYDGLYIKAQDDPALYPILASGVAYLKGLTDELDQLSSISDQYAYSLSPVCSSSETFYEISGSALTLGDLYDEEQMIIYAPKRKSREYYTNRLDIIDHTLSKSYEEVWQTFYSTSSEPHRSALFMIRTLYDNFFAAIAPDDDVRSSQFWKPKKGDKPNQIWRSERIAFALEKNISDEIRKNTLAAETRQIIALYELANDAHNRGSLDEDKASRTLFSMDKSLKDWLDALAHNNGLI
jgi:hypothetical protein